MSTLRYAGADFGEFCQAKTMELEPSVNGGMRCRVKLMLDARAKMDARAASALRHKLNALLAVEDGTLVLPEEPGLEYHGARVTDAKPWDELFEHGSTTIEFECADGVAYGDERTTAATEIMVNGTCKTYPTMELVATEGDSVMVLNLDGERFVNIVRTFKGGERVVMDFERETVTMDGADACIEIGLYSDFFSLVPGANRLAFAGCSEHMTRYRERWL